MNFKLANYFKNICVCIELDYKVTKCTEILSFKVITVASEDKHVVIYRIIWTEI